MTEVRDERRTVTALFADVVGSTALAEHLDPEDVRLIVGEVIARAIAVIERYGGTIKDLAGDGMLALFGAPVAHEDDPVRAVRAAWEIVTGARDYAEEVRRSWGVQDFAMRAAVHTGEASLGALGAGSKVEYGAVGDSVNSAARLQALAEPGTVLVSEATQKLVAPLFDWGDRQILDIRGRSEPIAALTLLAVRAEGGKVRGLELMPTPQIGREPEMEVAASALKELDQGRGSVLFIVGEAGIGKSRMMAEVRRLASETKVLWLEGRCVSYGDSIPYWPYRDLIREWLHLGAQDPELRARVALRRQLDQLFPDRSSEIYPYLATLLGVKLEGDAETRLQQLSPESLQYRTFEVVGELLDRLSADSPVILALDDLHWADATSVQLTERLVTVAESGAILLLLAHRPERDHPAWALKEKVARDVPHIFAELNLRALGGVAERRLLRALVGDSALPPAQAEHICSNAEGNPFYLEEIVRSLIDRGDLLQREGTWHLAGDAELQIPDTVEKVILARIDRLPPGQHAVVTAAAVLGRTFSRPLLEAVVQDSDGKVAEAIHALQRLELIREQRRWPEPEYRFRHALIQEACYRTLAKPRRTELHRRAAQWLEDKHRENPKEVYGVLAHHWLAAADEAKAIDYLRLAADKARDEYALDEAVGDYRELIPLLERSGRIDEAAETLFKLALALHTAMRFEEATATWERAFKAWKPPAESPTPTATLRVATTLMPNDFDPHSAIAWSNIRYCMTLYDRLTEAWPNRNIVPSLAERWEVSADGLRYVFRLRQGLTWNDGTPLSAVHFVNGIRRVLNPDAPGSSVSIYFVLENALEYYRREHRDPERIGVRALDERTLEFRLVAPAPYFMNVVNRPDCGPHREPGPRQCGAFTMESAPPPGMTLARDPGYRSPRRGNVERVEVTEANVDECLDMFRRGDVDLVPIHYIPGAADLAETLDGAVMGGPTWAQFLTFNCQHPAGGDVNLRRALAYAIDRDALAHTLALNLEVARGGIVPPAVQGHTPDIALRFDPVAARAHLARSNFEGVLEVAAVAGAAMTGEFILPPIFESWKEVLGERVRPVVRAIDKPLASTRPFGIDAPLAVMGWLPGYPDPEYFLRLLLHSDALTNKGEWSYPPFDELIERARQERTGSARLALFHEADRLAVQDQCALIPLTYGRSMVFVQPWVEGWWEWGKSCANYADLTVTRPGRQL